MPNQGGGVLGDQRVEDAEVADDLTVGVRQQGKSDPRPLGEGFQGVGRVVAQGDQRHAGLFEPLHS
jgi:hypothetical protein